MRIIIKWSLVLFVITFILSCNSNQEEKYSNNTLIIAHGGNGSKKLGAKYKRNSKAAIKFGLNNYKGIEVDVQMSKDSSLWLIHDNSLLINDSLRTSIFELSDVDIENIGKNSKGGLLRMDSLFQTLQYVNNKLIYLDMKFISNKNYDKNISSEYINSFTAKKIIDCYNNYTINSKIAIECTDGNFLSKFISTNFDTYLLIYKDDVLGKIKDDAEPNFTGISVNFNKVDSNIVSKIKHLDFKVLLWVPNSKKEIARSINIGTDIIQSDNTLFITKD